MSHPSPFKSPEGEARFRAVTRLRPVLNADVRGTVVT